MRITPSFWLALAGVTALAAGASLVLTAWLDLHPCHLCIFQRLLFMVLAVLAGMAALSRVHAVVRVTGGLFVATALGGMSVAAYQSWLQWQPAGSATCANGPPGPVEKLVEWLGQIQSELFLATGFCEDKELTLLGLSLANLAFLLYLACAVLAIKILISHSREQEQ